MSDRDAHLTESERRIVRLLDAEACAAYCGQAWREALRWAAEAIRIGYQHQPEQTDKPAEAAESTPTPEELHHALDRLAAGYLAAKRHKLPSTTTVLELIEWSFSRLTPAAIKEPQRPRNDEAAIRSDERAQVLREVTAAIRARRDKATKHRHSVYGDACDGCEHERAFDSLLNMADEFELPAQAPEPTAAEALEPPASKEPSQDMSGTCPCGAGWNDCPNCTRSEESGR